MAGSRPQAIDLDGLLAELRNQYLNVPGKDVAIDYEPCRDCYMMANGLLRDVFANLIGNAIKHSDPTKSVRIGLGLERVEDDGRWYCRVTVEDDGPGIPDVQKAKVFTRFHKANVKAVGKGLGLYLVKSLVDDFHGTIHVEDRVQGDYKKGSQVRGHAASCIRWRLKKMQNGHIGIVEDEPEVANLYKTVFTAHGMSISFVAEDGLEAIKAFMESDPKPFIIIMDHRMPEMTSIYAMKEMMKLNSGTKYVIVSADSSIRGEAIESGAAMFLEKPIQLKQLIGCVDILLRQ